MEPDPIKNQENDRTSELIQYQVNRYSNPLPQVPRGQSQFFYKEITRDFGQQIVNIQIGFYVGTIPFPMLDLLARIINDIHNFDIPLKIIVDTNDIWVTSTIVYPIHSIGDSGYNIMQATLKEQLLKTRQIIKEILKKCEQKFKKNEDDEEVLKEVKKIQKDIRKAFKDPNSDH